MQSGGKSFQRRFLRWLDEWRLGWSGIMLATRSPRFMTAFILTFLIFGTLMTLLSGSTAGLDLFWSADLSGKLKIIGDSFLGLFGVNRNFWDWLLTFLVTILQSVLIGLIVIVWQKRRRSKKDQIVATAANSDNISNAGLAAGLAILGTGCPTCGTALIAPILGTLFSTGGYALAGFVSGLLTLAAALVALFSSKRLGNEAYALIVSERFQKAHPESSKQSQKSSSLTEDSDA